MKVGVLGGGQLARMLAIAGKPLGIQLICYESIENPCANSVANIIKGDFNDENALATFAETVDCITLETENIPLTFAEFVAKQRALLPNEFTLKITQDRLYEKECLQSLQIPTAKFHAINTWDDLETALNTFNYPAILKTRKSGYDGKGQAVIHDKQGAVNAWEQLKSHELILESFVNFASEVSLICVRAKNGEVKFYPLVENEHREGILRLSKAPFIHPILQKKAENYANTLVTHFNYIGVMAIEFFVMGNELIANEIAPRVHNSGHFTIEGARTSQFENHLRAICGLPLGSTETIGFSAMYNLIGEEPVREKILSIPNTYYHSYGKAARPGRKLGHITINALSEDALNDSVANYLKIIK